MQTEEQAQHAVTEGRNIPILGRHCRTEIAKVNRAFYGASISHRSLRMLTSLSMQAPCISQGSLEETSPTKRQGIFSKSMEQSKNCIMLRQQIELFMGFLKVSRLFAPCLKHS